MPTQTKNPSDWEKSFRHVPNVVRDSGSYFFFEFQAPGAEPAPVNRLDIHELPLERLDVGVAAGRGALWLFATEGNCG